MSEQSKINVSPFNKVFFTLILIFSSFFLGTAWFKYSSPKVPVTEAASNVFAPETSNKPVFEFYVMSFCPYGNQIESVIKPVAQLLDGQAEFKPRYIFEKINGNLTDYCKSRNGDPNNCETYVKNSNGQLKNIEECQKIIESGNKQCVDEKNYLKIENNYYSSLHGRVEANQNVREICAYNLTDDKKSWWNFLSNVNDNCNAQNADVCWEEQANKAGLDTTKITECFNKDAASLIETEIAKTEKFKVQGSPTLFVNEALFPPESTNIQNGKITINKKTFTQDKFRTSNVIKEAVCAGMKKLSKECSTILPETRTSVPAAGGCH